MIDSILELATHGIGIHHAGLGIEDRKLVEDLFLGGIIRVLIATSVSRYQPLR